MRSVYVDTSALLPFLDADDADHAAVEAEVRKLVEAPAQFVTTSYVLVETGALVRSRLGMTAFQTLGEVVSKLFEVVWVDEELHHRAWRKASAESRRGASLVDWVGFLTMRDLGLTHALAIDRDFLKQGFSTIPQDEQA